MKQPPAGLLDSLSKQFVEHVFGFLDSLVHAAAPAPVAQCEVEVLAKVGSVFFCYRLGPALEALISDTTVVVDAVEADAQIFVASVAALAAAGLAIKFPLLAAVAAMPIYRVGYLPAAWMASASVDWPSAWRIWLAVLAPVRPCFSRR